MTEARLFQALSDPTRLKIVGILAEGPLNVTRIVGRVKAAQPAVSRHLRILREVGLITDRRLGKEVEYSLEAGAVEQASVWLGDLAGRGVQTRRPSPYEKAPKADRMRESGKGKMRRVSPLEARGGVLPMGPESQQEVRGKQSRVARAQRPHVADGERRAEDESLGRKGPATMRKKGPGMGASGGGRRRGGARKKERPKKAQARPQKGKPQPKSAFVVEHEEETLDDFLL